MAAKGGKKGRKIGKGKRKVAHSRFVTYAGIMGASKLRKEIRVLARKARLAILRKKRGGFRSKREALRFAKFGAAR